MEKVFSEDFKVPEGEFVIVTYNDGSQKSFDGYDWGNLKHGIRNNLFDKGLIKNISLSWKENT